jgi:hypothetical protein
MRLLVKGEQRMSHAINLELSEELYRPLLQKAASSNQTPEEWMMTNLRRLLGLRDEALRRHFGSVDLGHPTGTDNENIDADLARAYSDTHG